MCFAAFGGFRFFLHANGIGYIRHFLWTAGYFMLVAIITTLAFWDYIDRALQGFSTTPFIVLGIFIAVQAPIYIYLPRYFQEPTEYFETYPERCYLKIDWRRLVSKSMDILAQQVFIVLLIMFLRDAGLSLVQTIAAFAVLFGMLHVPLIASERGAWPSWLFAGIVAVFSIIFPILIIEVQYGFVYTYAIHWLFYMMMAAAFWMRYAERKSGNV